MNTSQDVAKVAGIDVKITPISPAAQGLTGILAALIERNFTLFPYLEIALTFINAVEIL